jgi:nucleobase:cation symporter-1, NCS1 family
VLAAQTIHQLSSSISATSPTAIVVFALIAMAVAIVGYDTIHLAQRVFAYLMIALLTVFSVGAAFLLKLPAEQWDPAGFKAVPFLTELFAAASYQLSWSIYVSDYSRYLPKEVGVRASFWWTYLGAYIGGTWMMLVGTVAAAAAPKLDVAAAMENAADSIIPGFGPILLTGALLGLICITSLNFYGASLTLLSVADTCKPLECTAGKRIASLVVAGIVSTILALNASGDFVRQFGDLLSVLLYLFTPWTAINLVDFYMVRKGHYSIREIFNPRGMYGKWNWRGLIAYFIGFVVMIPFFSTGLYTGSIAHALGGADIAMLVGLPIAGIAYLIACRSFNVADDRRLAETADLGLE